LSESRTKRDASIADFPSSQAPFPLLRPPSEPTTSTVTGLGGSLFFFRWSLRSSFSALSGSFVSPFRSTRFSRCDLEADLSFSSLPTFAAAESPRWLMQNGRDEEARAFLVRFHGNKVRLLLSLLRFITNDAYLT